MMNLKSRSRVPTEAEIQTRKKRRKAKENDKTLNLFVNFLINHRGGVKNLPLIFVAKNYEFFFLLDGEMLTAFNKQLLPIACGSVKNNSMLISQFHLKKEIFFMQKNGSHLTCSQKIKQALGSTEFEITDHGATISRSILAPDTNGKLENTIGRFKTKKVSVEFAGDLVCFEGRPRDVTSYILKIIKTCNLGRKNGTVRK